MSQTWSLRQIVPNRRLMVFTQDPAAPPPPKLSPPPPALPEDFPESVPEKSAEVAERAIIRSAPRLASWRAGLDAARFLVRSKLRSPYGGPKETFEVMA